jgi:IS5 family transposase
MGKLQSQLSSLGLKINMGMIQEATFVHSDSGHAKEDKPRENGAKKR